jgi:putative MATE family efflux protein
MEDLTTGSVARHLIKTASFMLVTMVFQTLYFLVDLYWVGRLGKEAVAAVGIAGNVMFIVLAATQMLGVGTTALISHASGQKDRERALLVFNQALVLSVVVGIVYFAIAMAVRLVYVRTLSADATTATLAASYLLWFIPATALQFAMVSMGAALRGTGNFKPGMLIQTATVIINMVLAPFLIFGWVTHHPLGVAGAAISTLIAIAVGTIWLTFYFLPKTVFLKFMPADWKPQPALWGRILSIGLPAGGEFALMGAYVLVVYTLTRPFGSAAQAGFGIGMRVVQSGFMPIVALGFAVAPVAGQNFGARHAARVRETFRVALIVSTCFMLVWTAACHLVTAPMIRFFSSDPQVIAVGSDYLRIISWNYVASGVIFVASSTFQAMGNAMPSLIASFFRIVIVAIPAFLLSRVPGFALSWLWILSVVAVTLQMVLCLVLLRHEFRLRLQFTAPPAPHEREAALLAEGRDPSLVSVPE